MSELQVSVDHINACFYVNFYLPFNFSDVEARQTTYFLVYYKLDGSAPLNSIPFSNAKCSAPSSQNSFSKFTNVSKNVRCALSCCANNNNFEAAVDYVFQVSMVLSRENSIITPLSKPAYATSWDSCMFIF